MNTAINQRFGKILQEKNISQSDFANLIGRSKQVINNWVKNVSPITVEGVEAILEAFPDLDARWFVTGKSGSYNEEKRVQSMVNEPNGAPDKDHIIKLQGDIIQMHLQEIDRLKKEFSDKAQQQ